MARPNKYVNPKKVSPTKVCDYIREVFLNGKPRRDSYFKCIDAELAGANYRYQFDVINELEARLDFEDLKTMIMEEDQNDMLRRSSTMQKKSMQLFMDLLDKGIAIANDPSSDDKELAVANNIVKSITPMMKAIYGKNDAPVEDASRLIGPSAKERQARVTAVIGE